MVGPHDNTTQARTRNKCTQALLCCRWIHRTCRPCCAHTHTCPTPCVPPHIAPLPLLLALGWPFSLHHHPVVSSSLSAPGPQWGVSGLAPRPPTRRGVVQPQHTKQKPTKTKPVQPLFPFPCWTPTKNTKRTTCSTLGGAAVAPSLFCAASFPLSVATLFLLCRGQKWCGGGELLPALFSAP